MPLGGSTGVGTLAVWRSTHGFFSTFWTLLSTLINGCGSKAFDPAMQPGTDRRLERSPVA